MDMSRFGQGLSASGATILMVALVVVLAFLIISI